MEIVTENKKFNEFIYYWATFILVLLSFVYKNERLLLYSFEVIYILLIGIKIIKEKKRLGIYAFWSAGFFFICLLSSLYAVDQHVAFNQSINVVKALLIGFSIVIFSGDRKKLNFVLYSILISAGYLTILLILSTPTNVWGTQRLGESVGLNSNDLGVKMAISSLIAVYFGKEKKKIYFYVLAIICLSITILSGSRKALVLIIVGLFFLFTITVEKRKRIIAGIPILMGLVYLLWDLIMTVPEFYNVIGIRMILMINGFLGQGYVDSSTLVRIDMIEQGMQLFKERPIFGYGIANFSVLSTYATYSHNNYVELLVGVGIVGALFYYCLYFGLVVKLVRFIKIDKQAGLFISLILGLAIMEYGLVTYYIEIYQIIIACAYSVLVIIKESRKDSLFTQLSHLEN